MDSIGAARGTRSIKSGQSKFFVGYKKHTVRAVIVLEERTFLVPLRSLARAGNIADSKVLKPLLNFTKHRLKYPLQIIIADQGYIDGGMARFLRRHWGVAHLVRPRKDMVAPTGSDRDGCPLCPFGERLIWEDYDSADEILLYRGNGVTCESCPLHGGCAKQFEFSASTHETFWGMIPSHSKLAYQLLRRLRPLIEHGFNADKNRHYLKDFYLNSKHLAHQLFIMSDLLDCLKIIGQIRTARGAETRNALIKDLNNLEIWD